MHELTYLKDLLVILAFAVVVVVVFYKLKLPAIAGFILSGILVGPEALGLINDPHKVEVLAEIGVALLLFGIGVELSLAKIQRLWRLVVVGGLLQVGLTALAAFAVAQLFGLPSAPSVAIGFVVALSSTAIVLRGLQQRAEVDAPHGQLILGILVFQDLSVVPIMLIIPLLIGAELSAGAFALTLTKSLGIIVAILLLALLVVPRVLQMIARTRQRQLFVLAVFVVCLGTAWLVTKSGASLAVGAFLAGLVVSGSEYRHQAMADMIAFRDIFASLFFVSIGMLLSPTDIVTNLLSIVGLLVAILLGKALIVFVTAAIMRMPFRVCLIAALSLAQVGEFSFIVLYSIKGSGLIESSLEGSLVTAAILSMFITPFAMSFAPRLAAGLGRFSRLTKTLEVSGVEDLPSTMGTLQNHVIVAGYGFSGRELSQSLAEHNIPYVVVDLNATNVRRAAGETGCAVFGDITSEEVMGQLGISTARELVLLINDPAASEHAVRVARALAPDLFISARTHYLIDVNNLLKAGANEVISAEREAAVQVASQLLERNLVDASHIVERALTIRDQCEEEPGS